MKNQQFSVVLMRPKYPFNIGATARAMQNMGLERLILVAPETEINVHAREGAASAQEVLARRVEYKSLQDFFTSEGDGLRLAFTRRDGQRRDTTDFAEYCQTELIPKLKSEYQETPIYLMFGCEDAGLSNEEVQSANRCVSLPIYGPNGSFNLSQAVLIALFVLQTEAHRKGQSLDEGTLRIERAPMEFPKGLIDDWLTAVGFHLETNRRRSASDVINNMLLRAVPTKDELRIFTSVLWQCIRKFGALKKDQKAPDDEV